MEGQLSPQVLSFAAGRGGLREAGPRGNFPEVRVAGLFPQCPLGLGWTPPHLLHLSPGLPDPRVPQAKVSPTSQCPLTVVQESPQVRQGG